MHVLYLDESGDPNSWDIQNHFVLSGLAVHEGQIYNLTRQLDTIQAGALPGITIPIAFHADDVREGRGRFREMNPTDRIRLQDNIYSVISGSRFPNLVVFATIVHVSYANNSDQVLHDAFGDICQRFNIFLQRSFQSGHPAKGLLVIDQAHERRYRQLVSEFQRMGTSYGRIQNIVDILYFAGRRDTRMLQLADYCAFAVYRHYERADSTYFNVIKPRFDRRASGQPPDGLKHLTRVACTCEACSWRTSTRSR